MTEYENAEMRANLEVGQVDVTSALNNGTDIPIVFALTRGNATYKAKLSILTAVTAGTQAVTCHLSDKTTTGMTAQARLLTSAGISDTLSDFTIFYEVWD